MRIRKLGWVLLIAAAIAAVLVYRTYAAEAAAVQKTVGVIARASVGTHGRRVVADVPSDVPGQFATTWTWVKEMYRPQVEPAKLRSDGGVSVVPRVVLASPSPGVAK